MNLDDILKTYIASLKWSSFLNLWKGCNRKIFLYFHIRGCDILEIKPDLTMASSDGVGGQTNLFWENIF
jgi:hypothetical protein